MTVILAAIVVPDDSTLTNEDYVDGLRARMEEFYPSSDGDVLTPIRVDAVVLADSAYDTFLRGADVGLDGAPDDLPGVDAAFTALQALTAQAHS